MIDTQFLRSLSTYLNAEVYKSLFDYDTVRHIKDWMDKQSKGQAAAVDLSIDAEHSICIMGTADLEMNWSSPTYQADDMLHSEESKFIEGRKVTGFIKYSADETLAFIGLLPSQDISIQEYVNSMTGRDLHKLISEATSRRVHVKIPVMEVTDQCKPESTLEAMGVVDAFDSENADFPLIGSSVHVSSIEQFCALSLSSNTRGEPQVSGTTAEISLDRPFLYLVVDTQTYTPIFIGTSG